MSDSRAQDSRSGQSAEQRRRKRKERAARSRAPEPKDIVSGAGQPLDPGVRRELEERLGHDLSRVRLHTGRDAGHLAGLLGADAVAVGQDIFFREGAYRPGTDEGRRLLAHELLHTVQNPHGLGALRAGRELGAVSMPQEAVEREAESAAQDLVHRPESTGPAEVERGQATPGWLRYATVDADRRRMEELDPATLVDRVANGLLRSLRGDPEDRSGRVRLQLARMAPEVQDSVLDRLELRLPAAVVDRLLEDVAETERSGPPPLQAATAPHAVPGAGEEIAQERDRSGEEDVQEGVQGDRQEDAPEQDVRDNEPGKAGKAGKPVKPGAPGGGRQDGRHEGPQDGRTAPGEERDGDAGSPSAGPEREDAPGGAGAAGRRQEGAKDEQERSQDRQEEQDTSRRDDRKDAEDARESASATEREQRNQDARDQDARDEGETGQETDESPQEPEKQAVQEEQRPQAAPAADRRSTAPGTVDRSGAEPGERSRTGGDTGAARAVGDPENEQDADDEPLGLDAEPAQDESDREAGDGTPAAAGQEPVPEAELVGYTDAARNPNLAEERRKGTAPPPAVSSVPAAAEAPAADQAPPESATGASHTEDEEDGRESFEDLSNDLTGGSDADPPTLGTAAGAASSAAEGAGSVTDAAGADRDRRQADARREDAEAARRDEEARKADAASPGATTASGETAPPDRLAKAEEDARTRTTGPASGTAAQAGGARPADGAQSTARKPEAGAPDRSGGKGTEPGTDTARDRQTGEPSGAAAGERDTAGDQETAPRTPDTSPGGSREESPGKGPATVPAPQSGPDQVSTPGPADAPRLAPGHGPSPMAAGPQPRTNTPKSAEAPGSGTGRAAGATGGDAAGSRSRPASGRRQAARQAARTASRGGGGGTGGTGRTSPAPVRSGGRSGGGARPAASGGSPGRARKETPPPDVSRATPESGLSTAAGLKPHQALETLKGVDSAVGRSVDKERTALRKAPPAMRRPSGSPRTVPGGPKAAAPGTYTNAKVARTQAAAGRTPEITGERRPEGEVPGANVPEPSWWDIAVTIGAQLLGKLLKEILPLDDLIDSILGLPTTDEGLRNARVGDAPRLPLENDSDPRRTDEQGRKLDERKNELHRSGREDAARPMGEDQIYPDVPKETLTGKVTGGKKGAQAGGTRSVSGGGVPVESASAVAEHDRGPQIRAGFAQGRQKMGQERQAKDKKAADDRERHDRDLKQEVEASGRKQSAARDKGRADIADSRDRWRKEQDDKVAEIDDKKGRKYDKVRDDIKKKEEDTDKDVDKRTEDDNKKIDDEQTNAEKEAEKKQQEGKDDADNWLEEAIEKLKQFFENLKNAIKSVFEKVRQVVTDLIDRFKQQVFKLIDDARNWVIEQINTFADALIALGDELLADYPAMRDKWRDTIDGARDWAVQKVNEAADALKEVAGKLLDGLCGALLAGLDALEGGLLAAVDIAESVTVGALEFGAAAVAALGEWAAIFNDIVSDPGDWISKAGAAAETGAKQHLFEEIKTAVRAWFGQKVQEIIGIPVEDFQELVSGGVTVEQMAQLAWDEAVPQLPFIIGVMVVEKVVAKLIPGAGWVMAVIDALQTAWGALSEILAAFGLFMDFLKSVKSGNGALPFAKAVAAGVVALLELIYQFLIEGVSRFMGKVAERLGDMLKGIRAKKRKPGPSDDKPDAPARPADDRPAPADDRTDDRPGRRPAPPRKPSPDRTSRPPSKPRPGKRSTPEKKPRPSHTTRPKKRRDDDERRDDAREVNAARRRMRDAERRMKDDDHQDRPVTPTRRGPARDTLRPDRRRGTTDRDRDRGPRETRPGDRRGDDRRRDTDRDRRPGDRTRGVSLRRARQTVKAAANRARRAARRLHGKARRTVGNRLDDRLRRLRDQWRRHQDRARDRDRRRTQDRDRQREPEGRKDYELPQVRFRTDDGELHTLLFNGKGRSADLTVRSTPQAMRSFFSYWAKENELLKESDPERWAEQHRALKAARDLYTVVEGRQDALPNSVREDRSSKLRYGSPVFVGKAGDTAFEKALNDLRELMEDLAELLEARGSTMEVPPLPPTILPPFADGPLAAAFRSHYIKKRTPKGTDMGEREKVSPLGWDKLTVNARKTDWVRMHMLPARLGGHATTSNLVPARKSENKDVEKVEHPAALAVGKTGKDGNTLGKHSLPAKLEKMVWYDVRKLEYHPGYPGFPRVVHVHWGSYKVEGGHWKRSDELGRWPGSFDKPEQVDLSSSARRTKVNVNKATSGQVQEVLPGISDYFAQAIVRMAKKRKESGRKFTNAIDLANALEAGEDLGPGGAQGGANRKERQEVVKLIKKAGGKLTFGT
ncbi:eCIS core domain-containing protein [Streptomyces sp. bgisy032]|uniref:eCIS core domain-containing protein n=1 Tax=Streptomyces sp. bgisy032 TaxID=3413773 RepID=UPI003D73E397